MTASLARRAGVHDAARAEAAAALLARLGPEGLDLVRIAWCDVHGFLRGKTLVAGAVGRALDEGIGFVSTLLLKDSSDRTVVPVFERGGTAGLPGFGAANNLLLLPDPASFQALPWAPGNGWLRADTFFPDGSPVPLDARRVLQRVQAEMAAEGYALRCGLEVEFHVYRITDTPGDLSDRNPHDPGWPALPPQVELVHPGYRMLAETSFDECERVLRIVQRTAQGLGLPLSSLEVEFGPSQLEAVFDATDALTAADQLALFRNGVKMALRRAGYHATFMCRPPFANVMASGWHLHQSLVRLADGANAFVRDVPGDTGDASQVLSDVGEHYLAGLLHHARGMTVFCVPTINGYGRFRPHALAPQAILWGRDNRGAMLRVIGGPGDPATRIENRLGEAAANPYLYIAAQALAGLDGIRRRLPAPPATDDPYGPGAERIPGTLADALAAMRDDAVLTQGLGAGFCELYARIKQHELMRHAQAADPDDWQRREYFSRF